METNAVTIRREAQWMDSTLRVIGTLCYGEISRVLNAKNSLAIEDILNRDVIFELDALTNTDKIFFICFSAHCALLSSLFKD